MNWFGKVFGSLCAVQLMQISLSNTAQRFAACHCNLSLRSISIETASHSLFLSLFYKFSVNFSFVRFNCINNIR